MPPLLFFSLRYAVLFSLIDSSIGVCAGTFLRLVPQLLQKDAPESTCALALGFEPSPF
jgi:hypothetical protein